MTPRNRRRHAATMIATIIVLLLLGNLVSGNNTSTPGRSAPVVTAPQPSTEDDCRPEDYPDWTEIDYRASGKSSPVSLVPQYRIDGWEDFNEVFRAVVCGGQLGSLLRGPNRLVIEGILMALNGGKMPHFSSEEKRHDAVREVMGGWLPNSTRLNGMRDTPDVTKTVYAESEHGELVLKVDTIDHARVSDYAFTTFFFRDEYYSVKINVACMQTTWFDNLRLWRKKLSQR